MNRMEELIALAQSGDSQACEVLVKENSGLIWSVAKRFSGRGLDHDDLYQLGCLGFLKAVQGFDLQFGTQFSTYAVPKIAGEIRRFIRDDGAVKVSRVVKERAATIKAAYSKLLQSCGREPTLQELESMTGFTPEEFAEAEAATATVESIQQESGEDGFTLEHVLSDTQTEDTLIEQISLKQAVSQLPERERMLIHLRYYHGLTQQRIAAVLGVSQVQVSRIEKKAIVRLREIIS